MRIYHAVTARDHVRAAAPGRRFAHVAYRIGPGDELLRQDLPLQTRGDLMSLSDRDAPAVGDPQGLCAAVSRECSRRGYAGVVADFEDAPREDLRAFLSCLDDRMARTDRILYVPASYIAAAPGAVMLLCTAVSGGSFEERLREAAEARGGGDRIALDVQRLRMDFRLPAPTGEGVPLDAASFARLSEGRTPFFSPDLCARYFTYMEEGEAHFVLFDDADTLGRKLRLGERYGVGAAFLQWPEVEDLAGQLPRGDL